MAGDEDALRRYRDIAADLRQALTDNHALAVLTLVMRQEETLRRLHAEQAEQANGPVSPGDAGVKCALADAARETETNLRLLDQALASVTSRLEGARSGALSRRFAGKV